MTHSAQKASNEMTDIEFTTPTHAQVEKILREARRQRALHLKRMVLRLFRRSAGDGCKAVQPS